MNIEEAYIRYVGLINRNATNNNLNADKQRFVFSFNDHQIKYQEWVLEKRNEDDIRYVSPFLILNKELTKDDSKEYFDAFKLPKDYFDLANLTVKASSDKCNRQKMQVFEAKSENIEELLADENQKPSFYYRETFYLTNNNLVSVYKDNFSIDNVELSYYRYPNKVDIEGYTNLDGGQSQNIDPEWDDKATLRILIAMSKSFAAENGEGNKYQMEKDRLFTEI